MKQTMFRVLALTAMAGLTMAAGDAAAGKVAYDKNCHHFYFVPVDFPNRDGRASPV